MELRSKITFSITLGLLLFGAAGCVGNATGDVSSPGLQAAKPTPIMLAMTDSQIQAAFQSSVERVCPVTLCNPSNLELKIVEQLDSGNAAETDGKTIFIARNYPGLTDVGPAFEEELIEASTISRPAPELGSGAEWHGFGYRRPNMTEEEAALQYVTTEAYANFVARNKLQYGKYDNPYYNPAGDAVKAILVDSFHMPIDMIILRYSQADPLLLMQEAGYVNYSDQIRALLAFQRTIKANLDTEQVSVLNQKASHIHPSQAFKTFQDLYKGLGKK